MRVFITISFFLISTFSFGQDLPDVSELKKNDCIYKPLYSYKQRLDKYPFNSSQTVKLISFRHHGRKYPFRKDQLIVDSVLESMTLDSVQLGRLTNILFNHFRKGKSSFDVLTQCFAPRNAIVFLDSSGKVIDALLICFECDNFQSLERKPIFGQDVCNQLLYKLRRYFEALGVKYGTDLYEGRRPGETYADDPE